MKLESLFGQVVLRSPDICISTKLKIIYITYRKLRHPKKISSTFDSPVSNEDVGRIFKELMTEWGISDTRDWHLCIDAREEFFLPQEEMPDVLDSLEFKDITIFCSSIRNDANTPYIIECHPTSCIILSHWYDVLQEENIDWENVNWDRYFIILARNPSIKRVEMVKYMLDNYKDFTICSCGSKAGENRLLRLTGIIRKPITVRLIKNLSGVANPERINPADKKDSHWLTKVHRKVSWRKMMSPHPYPISIEDGEEYISELQGQTGTDYNFFNNAVNIICETMEEDWQQINLSEKTFKPFAWHQLPIWHASPGTVAEVRKLGFDVFDDIFDHSYDSMTEYDTKREFILNQVKMFKNKYDTYDTLSALRQELLPRLRANNERVLFWVNKEKEKQDPLLLNVSNPMS